MRHNFLQFEYIYIHGQSLRLLILLVICVPVKDFLTPYLRFDEVQKEEADTKENVNFLCIRFYTESGHIISIMETQVRIG